MNLVLANGLFLGALLFIVGHLYSVGRPYLDKNYSERTLIEHVKVGTSIVILTLMGVVGVLGSSSPDRAMSFNCPVIVFLLSFILYLKEKVGGEGVLSTEGVKKGGPAGDRMRELGEVAAGIAHEINNPLMIINWNIDKAIKEIKKENLSDIDKSIEILKKVTSTTERIQKIVRGLKNFSRDGEKDPFEVVDVKDIVDETLAFCEKFLEMAQIKLYVVMPAEETLVSCRRIQISQVVFNLVKNAADAIKNNMVRWIRIYVEVEGENAIIRVRDSGGGIPEDVKKEMFRPFYTSKPAGEGTGLGLSLSQKIVSTHRGQLYVSDCENTEFVIELPLVGQ